MRVRRHAGVLVVGLALVFALLSCATSGRNSGASATEQIKCGASATLRVGLRTWVCTFDDEFNGTQLDRTRWTPVVTQKSGWTTGDTCYVDNPYTIAEGAGILRLTAKRALGYVNCGFGGTRHLGGAVVTKGNFAQAYGRFDMRARFPSATVAGFWGNAWLYPEKLTYGAWPNSGEIDVAEHWSGHPQYVSSTLHYRGSTGADSKSCTLVDPRQFHTYTVVWTSSVMTFFTDGVQCFRRSWTAITHAARPFDRPFFVMLSEGFGDFNLPTSPFLPADGPVDVDYVRVYR